MESIPLRLFFVYMRYIWEKILDSLWFILWNLPIFIFIGCLVVGVILSFLFDVI